MIIPPAGEPSLARGIAANIYILFAIANNRVVAMPLKAAAKPMAL